MLATLAVLAIRFGEAQRSYVPDLPLVVLYEANLRAYGPNVGFEALRSRLSSIKALGVNVIWLMPVQKVGRVRAVGPLGSPYSLSDYDSVNPEFGSPDELKLLVRAAHRANMAVILDWVPDHTSWDSEWIRTHPNWYLHDKSGAIEAPPGTGWNDVAALNFEEPAMRREMIASMKRWIARFDVDGFRCDAADRLPATFWKDAISALRASTAKKLLMLAEGERKEDYEVGFDLTYGWNSCYRLRKIFAGAAATEWGKAFAEEQKGLSPTARRLRMTTNHDMAAFEGSMTDFYKTPAGAHAAFTLMALYGGNPLIYTGQEVDYPDRIPIFDHTSIDWTANPEASKAMASTLSIRNQHRALRTGTVEDFSTKDVVIFERKEGHDEVAVLVNVRGQPMTVEAPRQLQGAWKSKTIGQSVQLEPYECRILTRENKKG